MSTSLSTQTMVTQIQKRMANGVDPTAALFYMNEAWRKLNQMQKGGLIWQLKQASLGLGMSLTVAAPTDFDPGKSAWLLGDGLYTTTKTAIPYLNWKEFTLQEHVATAGQGDFSCWTFLPNFVLGSSYAWTIKVGPAAAVVVGPPPGPTLLFIYHAMPKPTVAGTSMFANGAAVFLPTPDEFDSMIIDLAVAEGKKQYRLSGWQDEAAQANAAIAEIIDTYRTDRYDLSGLFDEMTQAKEKATEKDK